MEERIGGSTRPSFFFREMLLLVASLLFPKKGEGGRGSANVPWEVLILLQKCSKTCQPACRHLLLLFPHEEEEREKAAREDVFAQFGTMCKVDCESVRLLVHLHISGRSLSL